MARSLTGRSLTVSLPSGEPGFVSSVRIRHSAPLACPIASPAMDSL